MYTMQKLNTKDLKLAEIFFIEIVKTNLGCLNE